MSEFVLKNIEDIVNDGSMDFSQYVIKNRALPDLYSGMKPIHLKILWSMFENKTFEFTKSATVSGRVMSYSPHGDCYSTIVNMAQKDRHIHPLIIGKGNWGSACSTDLMYASARYTECKLSQIALDCLEGVSKNMVEMIDNYDNSMKMPKFLPTKFPMILCMASNGIAVGMANNSPSFNLEDVCNATISYLNGEELPILIPDFASGGRLIYNQKELSNINLTGKGKVKLRAKYHIEEDTIVIDEIPYGSKVSVEVIVNKIIELSKKGKLKEVANVLNLTGLDGLSIEITCKKNVNKELLMQKLYKMTPLESVFSCNMNVLVDGNPRTLGVRDTIKEWSIFRQKCIQNGIRYDINMKSKKLHNLLGLERVLLDIDKAIEIIRKSDSSVIISNLMKHFKIDEIQANFIAEMKLKNINKDYILKQIKDIEDLKENISFLKENIDNIKYINSLIIKDLEDVISKFKTARRTEIITYEDIPEVTSDILVEDYNCRVILTSGGYIKKHLRYSENHKLKDDEIILQDIESNNKDILLLFTNKSNRYKISVNDLDTKTPQVLGQYIPSILELEEDEEIVKIASVSENKGYMIFAFENGKIAKIDIESYMSANTKLKNCYSTNSKILTMDYIKEDTDVLLISSEGKVLIINTMDINSKGSRSAQGTTAIKLPKDILCVGVKLNPENVELVTNKNKNKYFILDNPYDSARTYREYLKGKPANGGNFLINCRNTNDKIIDVK